MPLNFYKIKLVAADVIKIKVSCEMSKTLET